MNLLLLGEQDLTAPDMASIRDQRLRHIIDIHRAKPGDRLRVGVLNGLVGNAEILSLSEREAVLRLELTEPPPPPLPLTLILAMPRPKMLRRCLSMVAELGIKRVYLINSYRVEKSFWLTPMLGERQIHAALISGLEQAKDTQLPQVEIRKRFKPFVEDELPAILNGQLGLVAHPYCETDDRLSLPADYPVTACIGPEGGFIPYEVEMLRRAGCRALALGERIYRVETVLPLLAGRLLSA